MHGLHPNVRSPRIGTTIAWHHLSNATASFVLRVVRRVREHQNNDSKKTCVRRVVLDKWFPLIPVAWTPAGHVTHAYA